MHDRALQVSHHGKGSREIAPHRDYLIDRPRFSVNGESVTQTTDCGPIISTSEAQQTEIVQHERRVNLITMSPVERQRFDVLRVGVGVLARHHRHICQVDEIAGGQLIAAGSAVQGQSVGERSAGPIPIAQSLSDQANIVLVSRRSTGVPRALAQFCRAREKLTRAAQITAIHPDGAQCPRCVPERAVIAEPLGELSTSVEKGCRAVGLIRLVESGADVAERRRDAGRVVELFVASETLTPLPQCRLHSYAAQCVVAGASETVRRQFGASIGG